MNRYWALKNRKLREYMARNRLLGNFKRDAFDFLEGLLQVKARKRLTAKDAERHVWFQAYYKRNFYGSPVKQKHNTWTSHSTRASFPYYSL